jgi:hypothetical protein
MAKLGKEKLVEQLISIFKGAGQADIDEAVKEAKEAVAEKGQKASEGHLENLFRGQIRRLERKGVPEFIVKRFADSKKEVIAKAAEMFFPEKHIPFLPVIPKTYLTIYSQLPFVKYGDESGYTLVNPNNVTDAAGAFESPYYIFDVEDGSAMLGKTSIDSEIIIKEQGREALMDVELISLAAHSDVLLDHGIIALCSRFGSGAVDMNLIYCQPILGWVSLSAADPRWGAPSCGSRVTIEQLIIAAGLNSLM